MASPSPSQRPPASASFARTALYVIVTLTVVGYYFGRDVGAGGGPLSGGDAPSEGDGSDDSPPSTAASSTTCPSAEPGTAHSVLLESWPAMGHANKRRGTRPPLRPRLRACVAAKDADAAHELTRHGSVGDCTYLSKFVSQVVDAYQRRRARSVAVAHEEPRVLLVDIGAHVGACAIPAAAAGLAVVAVEADNATRGLLEDGARASQLRVLDGGGDEHGDDAAAFLSVHSHVPSSAIDALMRTAAGSVAAAPRIGAIVKVDAGDQGAEELRQAVQWLTNAAGAGGGGGGGQSPRSFGGVDIIGVELEVTSAAGLSNALKALPELAFAGSSRMRLKCFTEHGQGAATVRVPTGADGDGWCRVASGPAVLEGSDSGGSGPFSLPPAPPGAPRITAVHLEWTLPG